MHGVFSDSDDPSVLRIPTATGLCLEFEKVLPCGSDDPHFVGMLMRATRDHVKVEQQVLRLGTGELPHFLGGLYEGLPGLGRRAHVAPARIRSCGSMRGMTVTFTCTWN